MKAWRRPLLAGTLLAALAFLIAAIWLVVFMRETIAHLPRLPENPSELSTRGGTKIYAASGERIYTFNQSRQWVDLAHISPHAVAALLATEDSRFYRHAGIDLKSLLGALWANEQHGFGTRGGSTLTQQLAKRLFFSPDKTLRRKLGEILIALELEALYAQHFPGAIDGRPLYKDRLIELYLNTAFYGSNAYGLHDAAAIFFATTPDSLSIEQAALLIGMLNAPTAYNPLQHPERATSRLQHVLTRLQRMGKISAAQRASYDSLRAEELVDVRRTLLNPAPYWVEAIKAEVAQRWDTEALRYGALRIYTTLDMRQQKAAESAVERGLNALDARMGFPPMDRRHSPRAKRMCSRRSSVSIPIRDRSPPWSVGAISLSAIITAPSARVGSPDRVSNPLPIWRPLPAMKSRRYRYFTTRIIPTRSTARLGARAILPIIILG
jgi:membrane peptidoglycan carboxypeptidase